MTKGEINIQEVLSKITSTEHDGEEFLLKFVRSSGKKIGTIKVVAKARKGGPSRRRTTSSHSKSRSLHTDKGTIPITDAETGQYLSPLISHIIQFNDKKVIH